MVEGRRIMKIEPLVSVVTPVYNGEKYLDQCIESVLGQTCGNWEYILVNNCSTDRSLDIMKRYARRDTRIRVHENRAFVSATENHDIAFRRMSPGSRYCKVVHADDWLFPECIERMVDVAERNPSVGIVGAYRLDGARVSLDGLPYPSTVIPGRRICRTTLLGGPYVFGSPTSLLIRSEIIRKREPFYDERTFSIHADTAVCYDILLDWDFGFVHQVLTFTRRHQRARTVFAQEMNSYLGSSLLILKRYGPLCLSEEEYKRCFEKGLRTYYRFLARKILRRRGKEFWDFHRGIMEKAGIGLHLTPLVKAFFGEGADVFASPIKTLQAALRAETGKDTRS
jgi:glycosyltransferase involved in cell wall biosynthesis